MGKFSLLFWIIVAIVALWLLYYVNFALNFASDGRGHTPCHVDSNFKREFYSRIEYLTKVQEEGLMDGAQLTSNVVYLEDITLIEGHLLLGRYPTYESMEILKSDIDRWEDWYDRNKCEMTIAAADSLLDLHTISGREP